MVKFIRSTWAIAKINMAVPRVGNKWYHSARVR